MAERGLVLGTAGHIDHGKTALVEALTGKHTDRLPEERRRGISIELGFAELGLPGGRSLSVVDVPGHERLVRTMVAGASGIDLFLMVVACDDGVMPQTREHWAVLQTLGVTRGVIALTKCDLGNGDRESARAEAAELMPGLRVVAVSARTGEGLAELRDALAAAAVEAERELAAARPAASGWPEPAVLHVDRVFSVRGAGTVVTGTLWSGDVARGDRVEVLPSGLRSRVRAIQTHERQCERVSAGRRVALNLPGLRRDEVVRGDVVASCGSGLTPTYRLDCRLSLAADAAMPVGERMIVHHGTRDSPARVVPLGADGYAQLRLAASLVARAGDRVVVRRIAPPQTLGGGLVVDAHPRSHGDKGAELVGLIGDGNPEELLRAGLTEGRGELPRSPADWAALPVLGAARRRFSPERWGEAIDQLLAGGELALAGGRLAEPVRAATVPRSPPSHEATLGELSRAVLALLKADGPMPRAPQDLTYALKENRAEVLASLEELVAAGAAIRLRPSVYYARETLAALTKDVLRLVHERGSIALAELRDELRVSRKYAQALLEHLGGEHLLIRRGDRHYARRYS